MVERFNRTLKDQLAKVLFHSAGEWDQYLSAVVLSFNATPHSSTGYSPFFLAHGREPRLPAHMYLDSPSDGAVDTPQTYGSALVNRMETVFREVLDTSTDQRLKREYYFNRYEKFRPFKVGDLVWMNDPTTQRRKLEPKWTGPYRVVTVDMAGVIYTVLNVRNVKAEPKVVHYERLKPYRSKWTEPALTSTCAGQDKNKIVQDLRPLYTALSGSLPLSSGELWVGENEAPVLSFCSSCTKAFRSHSAGSSCCAATTSID